jgi:serine protease inhibitor
MPKTRGIAMNRIYRRPAIVLGMLLGIVSVSLPPLGSQPACSQETTAPFWPTDRLVSASTSFSLKLFLELAGNDSTQNILISPVGLSTVLAMTYNGAAGKTALEMADALDLDGLTPDQVNNAYALLLDGLPTTGDGVHLKIANSLWIDRSLALKQDFLESGRVSYGAAIESIDFTDPMTPDVISNWIRTETHGKIDRAIDKVDKDVVLYLIDAVYFKGTWAVPFDEAQTSPREFTLADGNVKIVPTMTTGSEDGRYYIGDGFSAARLDYGDGRTSMYLFLPDEESSLKEFYRKLDRDSWVQWLGAFENGRTLILLPRLKIGYDAALNEALESLGMRSAFGGADFSRMTDERVFISMVKHTTALEVNEEGTEGAASSAVELKKELVTQLAFLRPFFFAIVDDETGAIIFMGAVMEP